MVIQRKDVDVASRASHLCLLDTDEAYPLVEEFTTRVHGLLARLRDEFEVLQRCSQEIRPKADSWPGRILQFHGTADSNYALIVMLRELQLSLIWQEAQLCARFAQSAIHRNHREILGGQFTMHSKNVEAARDETLRLITFTDKVLEVLLETPDLLREDSEHLHQVTSEKVNTWRRVFRSEKGKVLNLEAVIAVVGATKAGKSTTINAIIGADILPNRIEPMTTYPTLIRNNPSAIEPKLHFHLAPRFQSLVTRVKEKLLSLQNEKPLDLWFEHTPELRVAEKLVGGQFDQIASLYIGAENVANFLGELNDFCRLLACSHIDIELPDPEIDGVLQLPLIEVSFYHIPQSAAALGTLTILDSPGPNEAGQGDRLHKIVQQRIEEASAVVLLCNCTEARTVASKELQDLVNTYIEELSDRLFLFVNKIDQLDPVKDAPASKIPEEYSQMVLGGAVAPARIFPIAARSAFLANWALRELKIAGVLPQVEKNGLTASFGERALGELWPDLVEDPSFVQRAAGKLWERSRFDLPLENVVRMAADKAALISMKAAAKKVLQISRQLDSFFGIRESATTLGATEILRQIEELEFDIAAVQIAREALAVKIDLVVETFHEYMDGVGPSVTNAVQFAVDDLFHLTKKEEEEEQKRRQKEARRSLRARFSEHLENFSDALSSVFRPFEDGEIMDEDQRVKAEKLGSLAGDERKFYGTSHRQDAEVFLQELNAVIHGIFIAADEKTQQLVEASLGALTEQVKQDMASVLNDVLLRAAARLKKNFGVTFSPPAFDLNAADSVSIELPFGVVREGVVSNTRYVERAGGFAAIKRVFADFLGERWGYDEIVETKAISVVNLMALRDSAMRQLGGFEAINRSHFELFVNSILKESVDSFFGKLKEYLEEFRGDLHDALEDTKLESDRFHALLSAIRELRHDVEEILMDAETLASGLARA